MVQAAPPATDTSSAEPEINAAQVILSLWLAPIIEAVVLLNKDNFTALATLRAPSFVPGPELRGTTSILWSCIVTLTACLYTALHLNVPTRRGPLRTLLYKGKWVLFGLIAPEIVLYLAISQFLEARNLAKQLTLLWKKKNTVKTGDKNASISTKADGHDKDGTEHKCDLKYAFFVVMGGMEVSVRDIEPKHNPKAARGTPRSGRLRATTKGILQLAKDGHFLPLSRSKISDKSKADVLQKLLVMVQIVWMATQCIARKVYGLPLALLEVHTMIHVLCAVVLLGFWVDKPKDVGDPELLDISEFEDLVALMYQESLESGRLDDVREFMDVVEAHGKIQWPNYPVLCPIALDGDGGEDEVTLIPSEDASSVSESNEDANQVQAPGEEATPNQDTINNNPAQAPSEGANLTQDTIDNNAAPVIDVSSAAAVSLYPGQTFSFGIGVDTSTASNSSEEEQGLEAVSFTEPDILRWKRIRAAVERIDGCGSVLVKQPFWPTEDGPRYSHCSYHESLGPDGGHNTSYFGARMQPVELITFILEHKLLLLLVLVLSTAYGGVQLAFIGFDFPTRFELMV
ncbi:hypothetical protein B0H63DRAFT_552440 [Podospora didyma]|uniref:Uncharacterized protein n=1 Tax=Podospora didyma TaxID=330526 RepID=A0AAE0K6W6_9PEZI|nr:hypothetical protein B0H63DRAFT_552440 [Podospora didyma]